MWQDRLARLLDVSAPLTRGLATGTISLATVWNDPAVKQARDALMAELSGPDAVEELLQASEELTRQHQQLLQKPQMGIDDLVRLGVLSGTAYAVSGQALARAESAEAIFVYTLRQLLPWVQRLAHVVALTMTGRDLVPLPPDPPAPALPLVPSGPRPMGRATPARSLAPPASPAPATSPASTAPPWIDVPAPSALAPAPISSGERSPSDGSPSSASVAASASPPAAAPPAGSTTAHGGDAAVPGSAGDLSPSSGPSAPAPGPSPAPGPGPAPAPGGGR